MARPEPDDNCRPLRLRVREAGGPLGGGRAPARVLPVQQRPVGVLRHEPDGDREHLHRERRHHGQGVLPQARDARRLRRVRADDDGNPAGHARPRHGGLCAGGAAVQPRPRAARRAAHPAADRFPGAGLRDNHSVPHHQVPGPGHPRGVRGAAVDVRHPGGLHDGARPPGVHGHLHAEPHGHRHGVLAQRGHRDRELPLGLVGRELGGDARGPAPGNRPVQQGREDVHGHGVICQARRYR